MAKFDEKAVQDVLAGANDVFLQELFRPIYDAGGFQHLPNVSALAVALAHALNGDHWSMDVEFRKWVQQSQEWKDKHKPVPPPPPVDLMKIRGSMWTARAAIPFGPRPNQPDNILAMDYYEMYDAPTRKLMLDIYAGQHRYTHAVTGPLVDPGGYHGQYPTTPNVPSQVEFDRYLDCIQEWEDRGVVAIHFCKPDAVQEITGMAALDVLYSQARAQRLLRVVVYTGWEPWKYEKTNAQWVQWVQHGAQVFPNAVRLIHKVCDVDAPTGGDDDKTFPAGQGNAISWQRVAPYLHGWLVQNCGYVLGGNPIASPQFVQDFSNLFNVNAGRDSLKARFQPGNPFGWPSTSANGGPLKVYAGEFAAYGDYWKNYPESEAIKLGDAALAAGADGSLDGCTVR